MSKIYFCQHTIAQKKLKQFTTLDMVHKVEEMGFQAAYDCMIEVDTSHPLATPLSPYEKLDFDNSDADGLPTIVKKDVSANAVTPEQLATGANRAMIQTQAAYLAAKAANESLDATIAAQRETARANAQAYIDANQTAFDDHESNPMESNKY